MLSASLTLFIIKVLKHLQYVSNGKCHPLTIGFYFLLGLTRHRHWQKLQILFPFSQDFHCSEMHQKAIFHKQILRHSIISLVFNFFVCLNVDVS